MKASDDDENLAEAEVLGDGIDNIDNGGEAEQAEEEVDDIGNSGGVRSKPNGGGIRKQHSNTGIPNALQLRRERRFRERFPEAEFIPKQNHECDHEVWCDLDVQLNHFDCLDARQQALLEHVYKKVNLDLKDGKPGYWKQQRDYANYDATATIVAMSDYDRQVPFIVCGYNGYSCGDRCLCPRCCYKRLTEPALIEFKNCFGADNEVFFVVISLSREVDETKRLIFTDLDKSEMEQIKAAGINEQGDVDNYGIGFANADHVEALVYWDIFGSAISQFTRKGRRQRFTGAFGGPELSVRFMPLEALPHANYLAWSPGLSADQVRELRRIIREKMRGCRRIKSGLYPKVSVYRIQTKEDFQCVIKYIFKPIDILWAYRLPASGLECEPEDMIRLNDQVNIFFQHMLAVFDRTPRMNRYGFCHAASSAYIGHVTRERRERRKKDAKRRKERRQRDAKVRKRFPGYQPHKRKRTKAESWELHLMRYYYKKMCEEGELPKEPPKRWYGRRSTRS